MRPIAANVLSTVDVRSPAGESVGKIVDVMLDTETLETAPGIDRTSPPEHADPVLRPSATSGRAQSDSHNQR